MCDQTALRAGEILGVAERTQGGSKKIVMVAFDLLYLNGYDLRKLPLSERKLKHAGRCAVFNHEKPLL